jgi:hypothetical protein
MKYAKKALLYKQGFLLRCRGRIRTSTGTLAFAHRGGKQLPPIRWSTPVGDAAASLALCNVYPLPPTPETRGYVCQKISSPHSIKEQ